MRRSLRFLVGALLGLGVLAGYVYAVGADAVLARATRLDLGLFAVVVALVVVEGVVDGVGVWASVRPLNGGLSPPESVRFALAGDFFDIVSPAGPVTSEPIMARFIGVATDTGYSDALGVRSVAKYVKSGAQVAFAAVLGVLVLFDAPDASGVLTVLGVAVGGLLLVGALALASRDLLSRLLVAVLTPLVVRVSALYRDRPHDRATVRRAVERFWERVLAFRGTPGLLALVALGGVLEQFATALALWVALHGVGHPVALLPILVVVPLPQVASAVPIPGSLGAYDLLLGGALVLVTAAPSAPAAAAVLVLRTTTLVFGATVGGVCVAFLRGWRPSESEHRN
ncbi:lysylphosphatidylglycerol synthase domain-containing protein [Salarchaeum japonicum]|uniref:lysylphosphatidylglycerol synthase domain-containing protein n=1 Tax=Salarchaeum japonicum TaxID=555573 RepID=UPI001D0B916C|nr:lysylphosphatidylglycerol synthase domain-containing protein [Salarchaeum japonicum]